MECISLHYHDMFKQKSFSISGLGLCSGKMMEDSIYVFRGGKRGHTHT